MFILLHGRTKDEAFVIGQEIADAVTAANPKPVKLRFEKVTAGSLHFPLPVIPVYLFSSLRSGLVIGFYIMTYVE